MLDDASPCRSRGLSRRREDGMVSGSGAPHSAGGYRSGRGLTVGQVCANMGTARVDTEARPYESGYEKREIRLTVVPATAGERPQSVKGRRKSARAHHFAPAHLIHTHESMLVIVPSQSLCIDHKLNKSASRLAAWRRIKLMDAPGRRCQREEAATSVSPPGVSPLSQACRP